MSAAFRTGDREQSRTICDVADGPFRALSARQGVKYLGRSGGGVSIYPEYIPWAGGLGVECLGSTAEPLNFTSC